MNKYILNELEKFHSKNINYNLKLPKAIHELQLLMYKKFEQSIVTEYWNIHKRISKKPIASLSGALALQYVLNQNKNIENTPALIEVIEKHLGGNNSHLSIHHFLSN